MLSIEDILLNVSRWTSGGPSEASQSMWPGGFTMISDLLRSDLWKYSTCQLIRTRVRLLVRHRHTVDVLHGIHAHLQGDK